MRKFTRFMAITYLAMSSWSIADTTITAVTDVTVEDARLLLEKDGVYRLQFRLINDSAQEVTLVGVSSVAASKGQLVYYTSHGAAEPMEQFTLKSDEEADFMNSHLHAQLIGLKLENGSASFQLLFRRGRIDGVAHVH